MKRDKYIYFILIAAIFNVLFRPSYDNPITLFRVLIPFAFILIYKTNVIVFIKLIKYCIFLIILSIVQYVYATLYVYPQIRTFSFLHLLNFQLHYISIFIVISLVYCLWRMNPNSFFERIICLLSTIFKIGLIIYLPYMLLGYDPNYFHVFGNINNFGVILSSGVLAVLFDIHTKKYLKLFCIFVVLFVLYYNDSKLALFGAVLGIGLFYINIFSSIIQKYKKIIFYFIAGCGLLWIYILFTSDSIIIGYSVQTLVVLPVQVILNGDLYDTSDTSITYRANCIIGLFKILNDSMGLGVGVGSSGLILQNMLPNLAEMFNKEYISSHIWWLEVMADLGWVIIIPFVRIYLGQVIQYAKLKGSPLQLFSQIIIISFPLWSMSASGLYTEYFSIIILSVSYIIYTSKNLRRI